ncbi:MAG: peptide-methionine (S)-S-oxide reductase MsrA [Solirubrobacteraceae bacterium]
MALFFKMKTEMVQPERALPGRDQPVLSPTDHYVLGVPLQPPFPPGVEQAVVALGCFWGAERLFWTVPSVHVTAVGYCGGYTPNPTYEEVCSGRTGHAEAVLIAFDPDAVSYEELLRRFWEGHDPTQGMRQGNDVGTQYRSAIYATSAAQREAAIASRARYEQALSVAAHGEITTEIADAAPFYYAEDYHQQYLAKKGFATEGGYCSAEPTGISCPTGLSVSLSTADTRSTGSSQ